MFTSRSHLPAGSRLTAAPGECLFTRSTSAPWVDYLESGRVVLGVMDGQGIGHQLGQLEGPCWLEATVAILKRPHCVDAVAQTEVVLRRVPLPEFYESLASMSASARDVLHDLALAHHLQSELAVSRLAKDAEARCAEWLLRQAQVGERGTLAVRFQQHKRTIAAHLGMAPETLSRVLRHLRELHLISGTGRVLSLPDPSALRALAGI